MSELKPCPLCGSEVCFHSDVESCPTGCHYVHCKGCMAMIDLSMIADPKNDCETLEELRAKIVPHWNRRATQPSEQGGAEPSEVTDEQIEALALEHEAFGFGRVDERGLTTHGFDPEGLGAFARAILALSTPSVPAAGVQEAKTQVSGGSYGTGETNER